MRQLALNLIFFTAIIGNALAQGPHDADTLATRNLDEVVITGQYEPQSVEKSVFRIKTIPMERIQARGAVRVQDVLNTELNIRFEQDPALGTSNMTIQGLKGQNIKLLIDGIPQVGRQSTDNSFNINQVNVNSIERIEIIEGPMSVIYGADALAGVINIITKKSADGKLDLNARIHEETIGKEYGLDKGVHNESVGVAYTRKKMTFRTDLSRNIFGGFKGDSTGREVAWYPKKQYLGNALVGYQSDRSRIYYRIDYLFEDLYNPANFRSGIALDQNYITKRLMHQVQGGYNFNSNLSFTGAFGYTNYSRRTRTTTVDEATGDVRLSLGAGQQDVTTFDGTTFRGTFLYKVNNNLSFQPGVDLNYEVGQGGRIMPGAHGIGDYAAFLSAEWTIGKFVQLRPGIRSTYNTKYNAPPVTPSINTKFRINDNQDVRLSYGRGFRAPSLRELYFDFVDASHNIKGNPNLTAEMSNNFNATWNWTAYEKDNNKITTAVTGFYNDINNMIAFSLLGNATSYINIDRYKTKGLNWSNTFRNRSWDFTVGFAYTGRYNELREAGDSSPSWVYTPEAMSNLTYRTTKGGWIFSLYYKVNGKTPYPEPNPTAGEGESKVHIATTKSYQMADASVQKQLSKYFTLTGGIRNLFNVTNIGNTSLSTGGTHSGGGFSAIGSGRSYFLDLTYMFNK